MRRGSTATIYIIGAIIVTFTLSAFFLLNIEKVALHLWALTFLVLAEVAVCTGLINVRSLGDRHNKVFVGAGIIVTLFLYFIATFSCTLAVRWFENKLNIFILFQLGIIALFAIAILVILAFSRRIAASDQNIVDDQSFMEMCERNIYNLLSDDKNRAYENDLRTLYESLKYSDKIGSSSVDYGIAAQINILENSLNNGEKNKGDIQKIVGQISSSIKQRKGEIEKLKRGGF